jgi:hypothetical protein
MKKRYITFLIVLTNAFAFGQYYFNVTSGTYENLVNPISVNNGVSWDRNSSYQIYFNFDFPILDQTYTALNVMAGGGLSFPGLGNKKLRVFSHPDSGYLLGDRDSTNSASPISYEIVGSPGQRILKIQWENAGFREWCSSSDTNDYVNFQIWLYEDVSRIEVHFGDNQANPGAYGYPDCNGGTYGTQFIFLFDSCDNALSLTGPCALPSYDFRDHCWWQPGITISGTPSSGTIYNIYPIDVNYSPFFTSVPVANCTVGIEYVYNILATDNNGDILTITAPIKPNWLSFTDYGNGTALLSGTPDSSNVGDNNVKLSVSDGTVTIDQNFTISVSNINNPPFFTSVPVANCTVGIEYVYNILATDNNGDILTITAPIKPDWLTFTDYGDGKALLSGTPDSSNVGDNNVKLSVSDGTVTIEQYFIINVLNVNALSKKYKSNLNLYPNPVQDNLYIDLRDYGIDNVSIKIYDIIGQVVLQKKFSTKAIIIIPFSNLKNSLYVLDLQIGNITKRNLIMKK